MALWPDQQLAAVLFPLDLASAFRSGEHRTITPTTPMLATTGEAQKRELNTTGRLRFLRH